MNVVLSETQVSDLFFNHNNENMEVVYSGDTPPTVQEFEDALAADAKAFSELLGGQVEAQWLVDNYKSRR